MKQAQAHKLDDIDWKGYTLDELRYQRAYTLARLEIEKERISSGFKHLYSSTPGNMGSGIMKKMIGGLNYVDYALIAFKLGKRIYKMFR